MKERAVADEPNRGGLGTAVALRAGQLASFNPAPLIQANNLEEFVADLMCWEYEPGTVWVWQFLHWSEADEALEDVWPPEAVLNAVRFDVLSRGLQVRAGPPFTELGLGPMNGTHYMPDVLITAYDGIRPGLQLYRAEYNDIDSPRGAEIKATSDEVVRLAARKKVEARRARGV